MANMRRRSPEPPPGAPRIEMKPGMANETLRELAPLHNMAMFTPVGKARDWAVTALRLVVEAIADGNNALAGSILEQVQPESKDNSTATVAACIGVSLGLLDDWLGGGDPQAPEGLGSGFSCRPGTGSVSGPRPTSSSWPARAGRSGRWTR